MALVRKGGTVAEDFALYTGFAQVNGARLYYEIAGEGEPIVLIHAGIADCRMWDAQFRHFASHSLVIQYDMRGYGRSKMIPGEYSNHGDLVALLDTLGVESAALVGHSLGAATALNFALSFPERADALVLAAASLSGHAWSNLALEMGSAVDEALERGELERAAELELRMWVDGPARKPDTVEASIRERMRQMLIPLYETGQSEGKIRRLEPPAIQRLHEITVPTLVFVGDSDVPDMMSIADKLEAGIANARKVVFSHTAHMINLEQPERFNRLVDEFLEAL